jgi:tRNA 2-thiouridine synthesizing protein D
MGEMTILLTTGSMMTTGPYKALKLADAAMRKGHRVNLFCFGEGVTVLKKGQAPKNFPNLLDMMEDMMGRGLQVAACRTCSIARGYGPDDLVEGAVFGKLIEDYIKMTTRSDRLVHISF